MYFANDDKGCLSIAVYDLMLNGNLIVGLPKLTINLPINR